MYLAYFIIVVLVFVLYKVAQPTKFGLTKFERLFTDTQVEVKKYREALEGKVKPEMIELVTELLPGTMISATKNSVKAMGGEYTAPEEARAAIAGYSAEIASNNEKAGREKERADRKVAAREKRIERIRTTILYLENASRSFARVLQSANTRLENRKQEVVDLQKYM